MPGIFPPGGAGSRCSRWRGIGFALHQVQAAIEPVLDIREVMGNWREIEGDLSDGRRRRRGAIDVAMEIRHPELLS